MKALWLILLFPLLIYSQNNTLDSNSDSKKLYFSVDGGLKYYTGNMFLGQIRFSREGAFISMNAFTRKNMTKTVEFIPKISLSLSNAIAKKIEIIYSDSGINDSFATKIPNVLECTIHFSMSLNKKINKFFSQSIDLRFRLYPLFYQKGSLFNDSMHSLGGLISAEEDGSLPSLEKATTISYAIQYLIHKNTSIKLVFFANSDWNIHSFETTPLYPGIALTFEKKFNK